MAVTWKKLAYEDDVPLKTLWSAKGSSVFASAANTPAELAVGTDGQVIVADAASAPGVKWQTGPAPGAHAASHKDAGSDEILLHEFGEPTSAVKFDGQQATDLVLHNVADATARNALTPVIGKGVFQVDELAVYICTVAA